MAEPHKSGIEFARQRIKQCLKEIEDHVDSARFFVTYPSQEKSDVTGSWTQGQGNYYAQWGSINEWLVQQDAMARNENSDDDETT